MLFASDNVPRRDGYRYERAEAADKIERQATEIARLRAALNNTDCPRPANAAPDHLTVAQCIARGECGCDTGTALEQGAQSS